MWGLQGSQDEQKYHLENKFPVHPLVFLPSFFFSFFFFMEENKRHKRKKIEKETWVFFEGPQKQIP